jgi:uncharacterized protein YidB (DUF937 family)
MHEGELQLRRWDVADAMGAQTDELVTEAWNRIRSGVPALADARRAASIRRRVRAGIEAFFAAWVDRRHLSPDELETLTTPADVEAVTDVAPEDVLHAHRIVVEVVRDGIERTIAGRRGGQDAQELLGAFGFARTLERQLIEVAADGLARIQRQSRFERSCVEQRLVDELGDGAESVETAAGLLQRLGMDLADGWIAAATNGDVTDIRRAVQQAGLRCAVGIWSGATIVVTPAAPTELSAALTGRTSTGIARPQSSLRRSKDAFGEAVAVLQVACERHGDSVLRFQDARLDLMLRGHTPASELVSDLLAPLEEFDEDKQTWMQQTLLAYLDASCNVTAAARRLHLHRESMRYRLQQIFALFQETLDDPDRRLALHLALKAERTATREPVAD